MIGERSLSYRSFCTSHFIFKAKFVLQIGRSIVLKDPFLILKWFGVLVFRSIKAGLVNNFFILLPLLSIFDDPQRE